MDYVSRVAAYQRQNKSCVLTPRQNRRVKHKENRAEALAVIESLKSDFSEFVEVGPQTSGDLPTVSTFTIKDDALYDAITADDTPPPFVSLCTTCNVTDGPCMTKSGKPTKNHKGRK